MLVNVKLCCVYVKSGSLKYTHIYWKSYTFIKYTLKVKMTICINKVYGELGRYFVLQLKRELLSSGGGCLKVTKLPIIDESEYKIHVMFLYLINKQRV